LAILLIEDNKGAAGLIEKFFKDTKIRISLHVAKNEEEAVCFLCCENNFLGSLRPNIILLDLNLPKKDGREVLREIKKNSDLKNIPAIILTSSSAEKDILRAYNLHANAYIVKPIDFNELMKVIGSIEEFRF